MIPIFIEFLHLLQQQRANHRSEKVLETRVHTSYNRYL